MACALCSTSRSVATEWTEMDISTPTFPRRCSWDWCKSGGRKLVKFGAWLASLQKCGRMRRICCFRWTSENLKVFDWGELRPLTRHCSWTPLSPLRAPPQTPVIGSRFVFVTCFYPTFLTWRRPWAQHEAYCNSQRYRATHARVTVTSFCLL